VELGAGGGEVRVPGEAADVVDDLCTEVDGETRGFGFVGVDRNAGAGAGAEDGFDDGEYALLFGGGGFGGAVAGAGGFAADVEDVCTFIEEAERMVDGLVVMEKEATVGEGVWCDVEDGHDEGAGPEREGAAWQRPVKSGAGMEWCAGVGLHGWIQRYLIVSRIGGCCCYTAMHAKF
jgi:hypothetical protein